MAIDDLTLGPGSTASQVTRLARSVKEETAR